LTLVHASVTAPVDYCNLVLTSFDYCNMLLASSPMSVTNKLHISSAECAKNSNKLEQVQHHSARYVTGNSATRMIQDFGLCTVS